MYIHMIQSPIPEPALTLSTEPTNKPCFVYLLVSTSGATYVGATTDLVQRLRKHNKEISGGAHATSIKVLQGEQWTRVCHVANFPDWTAALQFEWRFKQLSRKYLSLRNPLERRAKALKELLTLERPTTKAIPYTEWSIPPQVVVEMPSIPFFREWCQETE